MKYLNCNYLQDGFYRYDYNEWEMEDDTKEDVAIDEATNEIQQVVELPAEDIEDNIEIQPADTVEEVVAGVDVIESKNITVKLEVNGIKLEIPAKLEGDEIKLNINLGLKV